MGFWAFCSYGNLTVNSKCPVTNETIPHCTEKCSVVHLICSRLSTPINGPISSFHTCSIQFRREFWFHHNHIL